MVAETVRGRGRPSKQDDIESWLSDLLSAGSRQANEIFTAGKIKGYSERTLKNVKKNLGIKAVQKNRAWFWQDPEIPEAAEPKKFEEKMLHKLDEMARAVQIPRVVTEDGVKQKDLVDALGYSKENPRGVLPTVAPMEISARAKKLGEKSDLGHDEIARQIFAWAYPACGQSESIVMSLISLNGIVVKPKSVLFSTEPSPIEF
jgi:hypothetical protein